jgi:glycosyltransferase involved in cell wall biosynthesis
MGWSSYLVDELWVGSEHVKKTIEPAVARPVRTFPVPIRRPSAAPVSRSDLGLPADRFAFVFSFNFVSVFERKNPLGLVDAFSRAFAPGEGPILVIKTVNGGQFPRQFEQLHRAAGTNPDVFVIDKSLPAENYHGLVASCDAYASLHRAEGFGLTIAEAMALGKPAVATGYSGNLEFMNERNSYLVPSRLVPIPTGVEPYVEGGFWAEPDLDAAAAALRQVVEDPGEATARAELASSEIERLHGFDAAASFVLERLAADPQTTPPPDELVERAAYELMWGPDLENARPWARMLRQALRPFLRPYVDHQRRVGALVLDAIREREAADRGRATEDESSPVRARKG